MISIMNKVGTQREMCANVERSSKDFSFVWQFLTLKRRMGTLNANHRLSPVPTTTIKGLRFLEIKDV